MRVLQLIDSLEAGGAERMAVNFANSLAERIEFSALVATRKEGILKEHITPSVSYLFLEKNSALDFKAVLRLKRFVKIHQIKIVHAHGTSFFTAFLLKLTLLDIKIIWHDHNGNRNNQKIINNKILWICSWFFNSIITVNLEVEAWAKKNLAIKSVCYLPNFTVMNEEVSITTLKGIFGKRIVCVSNLRHPKNHVTLVNAFADSNLATQGWTLHLVGKDYEDVYSNSLKDCISRNRGEGSIFLYGSCPDIYQILKQCSVGVLASLYEGFPVTLLEYGISRLPVISTNVGYCRKIIEHNQRGLLFNPQNSDDLRRHLEILCNNESLRNEFSEKLSEFIKENFSEKAVVDSVIKQYKSL